MNLILEKLFLSDRIFLLFSICFSFPLKDHKFKKTLEALLIKGFQGSSFIYYDNIESL